MLYLGLYLGLIPSVNAQSFTVTTENDTVFVNQLFEPIHIYATLKNNSSDTLVIDVIRIVNDTKPDWVNAMCVGDTCYYTITDSARTSLLPNEEISFRSGFFLLEETTTYIANSVFEFRDVNKSEDIVSLSTFGVNVLTIVSSNKEYLEQEVNIFPNPAGDYINIETSLNIERISIYNVNGVLIKSISSYSNYIDVIDLAKGRYLLRIDTKDGVVVKDFVKTN